MGGGKVILFVCEDCRTHTTDRERFEARHLGHHVLGIEGDDYEELLRVALRHMELAAR